MLDTASMTTSRHIKQSNVFWSKLLNSKRRLDATPGIRFYWNADSATRMRSLRSAVLRRVIYYVWIRCIEIERWWGGKRKSYGNRFFSFPYGRDAEAAQRSAGLRFGESARASNGRAFVPVGNPFLRGRSGARVFTTSIHLNFYRVTSLRVYIFHFTAPPPLRSWRRSAGRLNGHYVYTCARRPAVHAQGVPRESLFQFFRRRVQIVPMPPLCRCRGGGVWSVKRRR